MSDSYQPKAIRRIFKLLSRIPSSFVFASERTKSFYSEIANGILYKPYKVIQAPVDIDHFSPIKGKKPKIKGYNKVMTIGFINVYKGLETLIQTAHYLSKKAPEIHIDFYIIGPVLESQNRYKRSLDLLINEYQLNNIHFLGYRQDTAELLKTADMYLCSSIKEASPIAVWEAMATGLPVVSTDVGDIRHIFNKYSCGICVPVDAPVALSEGIIDILSNDDIYNRYCQKARLTAIELFDIQKIKQDYLSFFSQLVNN